jgi:outer membrane protein assembly factor BamE (lipoprotein component of BamABCDE complex)
LTGIGRLRVLPRAAYEALVSPCKAGRTLGLQEGIGISMKLGLLRVSAIALAALLATGCATNRIHKGAVIDPQLASSIQPGVDNKDSVQKLLGTPSFTGPFSPDDWYYVSRDTNQLAFRNPGVVRQLVMIVHFNPAGNVASVQRTGKELVLNVDPSGRQTPSLGRKKSFFDELFGNIGSVSSGGGPAGGGGGPY